MYLCKIFDMFCMFSNPIVAVFQCIFTSFPTHFLHLQNATHAGILIKNCTLKIVQIQLLTTKYTFIYMLYIQCSNIK